MSMSDPISDLLTRVRNAGNAKHSDLKIRYSKIKHKIVEILLSEGFISAFEVEKHSNNKSDISITLKYVDKRSVIQEIKRISKPGRRIYLGKDEIKPIYSNMGVGIISTSQGIMTSDRAKKLGIGGEFLCQVF